MMCMLLFNFVNYVFLFLYLCILIFKYVPFCIFCFHRANWHSLANLTDFSVLFPQSTRHGPHSSQLGDNFYAASSSLILV